ncbi:hypothetical protein DENSPDRAFT_749013, partial [Dentipellis sp. KUC8613]
PEWVEEYIFQLVGLSNDKGWLKAVALWGELEGILGYPDGKGRAYQLSTVRRPGAVHAWLKSGRDFDKPPIINDLSKYADGWRAWWIGLQPAWRGNTWPLQRLGKPAKGLWASLTKGGRNGFVLVVLALGWW